MTRSISACAARILLLIFPFVAYGAEPLGQTTALAKNSSNVLNLVVAAVFILAIAVFGWGIVKYISAAGDAAKIKDSKAFLFWGIIGVFVLASMWGLIKFIAKELSIDSPDTQGTILPLKVK